ncbi:uncharacterized protein LOC135482932 [Lineus longissimus]|uniref:uncharacterized protein LOC135482932 n=1 Tax=Lineus longissimus TaxID=88925 RepID=UPI00315D85D8
MPAHGKRKSSLDRKSPAAKRSQTTRNTSENASRRTLEPAPTSAPPAYSYNEDSFVHSTVIGPMNIQCRHCKAVKFKGETPGFCCNNGKLKLPEHPTPPPYLNSLISNANADSTHFLQNIRSYNSAFQMTSFGCNRFLLPGWNPTYTIQGQVCHRIGDLYPDATAQPQFLQIYFVQNLSHELKHRQSITGNGNLRTHLINGLNSLLHAQNKYIRQLKSAVEYLSLQESQDLRVVIHEDKTPQKEHPRRYNAPSGDDVGILMPNEPTATRDIILHQRSGHLQHISELHRAYDALQYPILFPYGTDGYSIYLKSETNKKVTQMQYYAYHLQCRPNNYIIHCRHLFQQFLVDVYCKIETERLLYLRREQRSLRADSYHNLRDSILSNDADPRNVGQRFILPSSYTAGPRYMHERQQDAISYVRLFGRPSLFITTTTNPKWPEILSNLFPHEAATDRPDVVVRVFNQKLKVLMKLLKQGAFGDVQAWLYSVEFQKRGLPHAHLLIWLTPASKITPDVIDSVISAEIPDSIQDKQLHEIVKANMVHGPCGPLNPKSPCIKEGKCTKDFPKSFRQATEQGKDGYPKYRRRMPEDGGNTLTIRRQQQSQAYEIEIDNRWIVPFNPWLLRQMNCHTNVEICSSIKSIKYVLKYVNKGSDQAIFSIQNNDRDEIKKYQDARYVSSMEAAHRILGYPMHEHFPPVMQLAIHLENGQRVYFDANNALQHALSAPPKTTLTEFFVLCKTDPFAATLLYVETPQYYTWNSQMKQWNRRKRGAVHPQYPGVFKSKCIGCVYTINPKQMECFYLRILLHHVRGPTSYATLLTVNGTTYASYRNACLAHGLIEDDLHLQRALQEACESQSPSQLRQLFTVILVNCEPGNPLSLWQQFRDQLAEDFIHKTGDQEDSHNQCLQEIEKQLLSMPGSTTLDKYGLPIPSVQHNDHTVEYRRYTNYPVEDQNQYVALHQPTLTDEQQNIYNRLVNKVDTAEPGLIFLDAPGGTGKTYLLKLLLAKVRSSGQVAIATASSGIAATLLPGGRTLHAMFKVPLDVQNRDMPTWRIELFMKLSTERSKTLLGTRNHLEVSPLSYVETSAKYSL